LHNFAPKLAAKFLLVEWEREDSYSVVSSCQIKKGSIGQTVAVGDQVVITSGGQDYDARIMKTGNLCSHPIAHFLFARGGSSRDSTSTKSSVSLYSVDDPTMTLLPAITTFFSVSEGLVGQKERQDMAAT